MHKKGDKKERYCPKCGELELPYGWKWDKNRETIVQNPDEQKIILLAKRLFRKGLGVMKIQREFELRGVLNRGGNAVWAGYRIGQIVKTDGLNAYWQKRKALLDARVLAKKKARAAAGRSPSGSWHW